MCSGLLLYTRVYGGFDDPNYSYFVDKQQRGPTKLFFHLVEICVKSEIC